MNILMIEDNHSVCEMMAMFFKKNQWEYEFAYDGVAGEQQWRQIFGGFHRLYR